MYMSNFMKNRVGLLSNVYFISTEKQKKFFWKIVKGAKDLLRMGSSTTGKHKTKKDKKHKRHRSRSPKELRSGDEQVDLTGESSSSRHRHKHKKHKERHRDRQHKHRNSEREERPEEVIALPESDSDSKYINIEYKY